MMHWTSIVNEVSNYISNEWVCSVRKNGVTPRSEEAFHYDKVKCWKIEGVILRLIKMVESEMEGMR